MKALGIKKHPLLLIILGMYWAMTLLLLIASMQQNQGHFIYPQDDTYIHMAMAKNFAMDGVWGITKDGFTSSTSSPLWTLLLAGVFAVFGVRDTIPLILNLIIGSFTVGVAYAVFRKSLTHSLFTLTFLLFTIFFSPLPVLTLTGMEHNLHILLTICFAYFAARFLTTEASNHKRSLFRLMLLAALMTGARYEGFFLLLIVCLFLLYYKKSTTAFLLWIAGLVPVTIYGIWSVTQGWYFLPNSILLKGNLTELTPSGIISFLGDALVKITINSYLLVLIIASLIIFLLLWVKEPKWDEKKYLQVFFLLVLFLHILLAGLGFRYEGYLLFWGLITISLGTGALLPSKHFNLPKEQFAGFFAALLLCIFLILPLAERSTNTYKYYALASSNIYEQQYQMGLFLNRYYPDQTIGANDIGAINYLADIHTLDLWGLSSLEIAQARLNGEYNTAKIYQVTRKFEPAVIIIYEDWFKVFGGIPPQWEKAGEWQLSEQFVSGNTRISFYAMTPSAKDQLIANLREHSKLLPPEVIQTGEYMQTP